MPVKKDKFDEYIKANVDEYGKAIIDRSKAIMSVIDEMDERPIRQEDLDWVLNKAKERSSVMGLSGYQAYAAIQTVADSHTRGLELLQAWNSKYADEEDATEMTKNGAAVDICSVTVK